MENTSDLANIINPETELLNALGLTMTNLNDLIENTNMKTTYICDFCQSDCIGDIHSSISPNDLGGYGWIDMCDVCYKKFRIDQMSDIKFKLTKCNKYDEQNSYVYKIVKVKKISNNEFLYVISEENLNAFNKDVHYYLKYFLNQHIFLDWEIDTYNPYFGCDVLSLDLEQKLDENKEPIFIAKIKYSEKHKICEVQIKSDYKKSHKKYLGSKPNTFSRSQNEKTSGDSIGTVIEFIKAGKQMESLKYF